MATFTPYALPDKASPPANITKGPDGNLWFTQPAVGFGATGEIGKITPSGTITSYTLPTGVWVSSSSQITAGADGNLWFTANSRKIGKISTSGQIQTYDIPNTAPLGSPVGITAGPDGNVWFVIQGSFGDAGIGKITPSGQITAFPVPRAGGSIVKGGDGNLWFPIGITRGMGKISPTGIITDYAFADNNYHEIHGVTAGPDGNVWFLEIVQAGFGSAKPDLKLGKVTPSGQITEYSIINGFGNLTSGGGLTAGPGGKLYLSENNQIGQVTLGSSGSPTFVEIANSNAGALSQYDASITAGPDGNIWYTQQSFAAIVKLSVGGTIDPPPGPIKPGDPTLRSIVLTPANPSVAVGATQQFNATGNYSDNSIRNLNTQVAWASASPGVATISASGLASGLAAGSSVISVSLNGISAATTLTVTPGSSTPDPRTLRSIALTPANPSVVVGATQQFIATGTFSDNSTQVINNQVTWASATPGVATISASGLANGLAVGSSVISASLGGITATALLTVTPAQIPIPIPLPPSVTGIAGVTRTKKGITAITVDFNEALNPASATNSGFYNLALGVKKKRRLVFSQGVRIKGLSYDDNAHAVTIRLAKPTKRKIRVLVRGGIAGAGGGVSSSDYSAVVP